MILINPFTIYDSDIDTLSVVASNSFKLQHVYYSDGNYTELPCISWMYCLQQDPDLCERAKLRCRRMLDQDGPDSVGPWSILVFFSCWKLRDGWLPGMARDGQGWAECARWGWSHRGILYFHVGTSEWTGPFSENDEPLDCWVPDLQWSSIKPLSGDLSVCHAPSHSGWKPLCCRRTTSQATRHGWKPGQVLEYLGLWQNSFHICDMEAEIACTSTLIHVFGAVVHLLKICSHTWPGISLFFPMFPARGHSEHRIVSNPCHDVIWTVFVRKNMKKHMTNTFTAACKLRVRNPCMSALGSFALAVFHKTTFTLPLSQTAAASSC